jgi:hypothetical protein
MPSPSHQGQDYWTYKHINRILESNIYIYIYMYLGR